MASVSAAFSVFPSFPALVTSTTSRHRLSGASLHSSSALFVATTETAADASIEYCTGCRWNLRSMWYAQELLTTFRDDPSLKSVSLLPSRPPAPGGVFKVSLKLDQKDGKSEGETTKNLLLWDRKIEGRFPEAKELKQRLRDVISPDKDLGHSDNKDSSVTSSQAVTTTTTTNSESNDCIECKENKNDDATTSTSSSGPVVSISYCVESQWLFRSAWLAEEILSGCEQVHSVTLIPRRPPFPERIFKIDVDKKEIWSKDKMGNVPDAEQIVDIINTGGTGEQDEQEIDDAQAEEMRKYFGVM